MAVKPVNGLANRLRVVFSYKILADFLDIPYYLYWNDGIGFDNTNLTELIVCNDFRFINKATWSNCTSESFSISDNISGLHDCDNKRNTYIKQLFSKEFKKITTIASNYLPWSFGNEVISSAIPNFKQEYIQLVSSIKPTKEIAQLAYKTLSKFETNNIGVHIRRGDALSEKNVNHNMHNDGVVSCVIDYLKENPNQFFLCTDDENVNEKFKSLFGKRCITYEKKFQSSEIESDKLGQKDAMVDLFLLSSTSKILATSPSSFAKFASVMGGTQYYSTNKIVNSTNNCRKMIEIMKS
ncbi:MAG: hypothetical protein CBC02_009905 [Flavobacteriaceae bacterium TMED42]|nr:MAG: hypothetical protein CBC02_009905 [Flavobacteriaceae bacterium TMED42]